MLSIRLAGTLAGTLFLFGCMSLTYRPAEYELAKNRIADFTTSGPVNVGPGNNPSGSTTIFKSAAVTWSSSYEDIAKAIATQLQNEISRHGQQTGDKGKNISVTVSKYYAEHPPFIFEVSVEFTVSGDNGFSKSFQVKDTTNGSVGGDITRSFNSAIAVSVIHALRDKDVLTYLSN